jgi:hypothetical protein
MKALETEQRKQKQQRRAFMQTTLVLVKYDSITAQGGGKKRWKSFP